jgi:predicted nucleotidyltransferase
MEANGDMTVIALIEQNRVAIGEICEEYGVERLAVFGAAVSGTFNPAKSDVDFAVEFADYGSGIGRRFMRFIVALEDLLGARIDIVAPSSITNPYFRRALDQTAVTLDEARSHTTAA